MRNLVKGLLLFALVLVVAIPTMYTTFIHSERQVVIGAHQATVTPSFDGHARLDFGPILPDFRIESGAPLRIGAVITLGDSDATDLSALMARDALIASQPEGEIAVVRDAIVSMAIDAVWRGVGATLLVVLAVVLTWRAVGGARRREILARMRRPTRPEAFGAAGISVVLIVALTLVTLPERPRSVEEARWLPLSAVFSEVPAELDKVQVKSGASARGGKAVIEGALETYQASVKFYGELLKTAETTVVRTPGPDETTALVVTDRHDNIGMDPIAREIARRADASILIDLGDDTSTGGNWEGFSINSLAREFRDIPIVAVAGNHDTGPTIVDAMKKHGFTVLDGKPVKVEGVTFIGSSDPRSSGLTAGYAGSAADNNAALRIQDQALTDEACANDDVSVAIVHSPSSAKNLAASGCVDLVLSGHLHRQVGPNFVAGPDEHITTTLTTASTGGAVYAFALGTKLRREAQVTIVTFADGRPVGLQPVTFTPGGEIEVARYLELPGKETRKAPKAPQTAE